MVKIIAPFLIKGTIDDLNFVVTADGKNYARIKGKTGLTAEAFKNNPIFATIRNHGHEFGHCAKKTVIFRQLAVHFNKLAKEGSFAGRANKLLFEILQEDTTQPQGKRTLSEALKTSEGKELLVGFESNCLRPLHKVLKIKEHYNQDNQTVTLTDFNPNDHLDWPEEATHVHLAIAVSNWNYENDTFDSCYSEEIIMSKESPMQTIALTTARPQGNHLNLTFLYIGFAVQERRKYQLQHRKHNTTTLIAYHNR
ncbi:hypothetical protein ACMDB5_01630 [Flavobacterium sp. W1B]|uniref:hypothetical protein n=1 Tax=Flavobacterium sp. W1B TaxID=3394146 RepID=UPI0039BCEE3C